MTPRSGLLIAFEGIDGTGKSSQLPLLACWLREQGCQVVETREPTDGPYGQQIRQLFQNREQVSRDQELELFIQDRRQHVDGCILPALHQGQVVLTDRYYFSTAAYQGAAGCDPAGIFARNQFAPEPDMVLLLTMPPAASRYRIQGLRGEALNDFEQQDQLEKVAALFASFQQDCIVRIAADRPLAEVQAAIREVTSKLLAEKEFRCST